MSDRKVAVTVALFASLREIVGKKEIEIEVRENTNVREILELLGKRYAQEVLKRVLDEEQKGLSRNYMILIDGRNIQLLDGLDTKLRGDERITILPPIGGGLNCLRTL